MSMGKILIAEDDRQMIESLKTLLESNGFDVIFTEDPREVINMARNERPSLIILDVIFEGTSGPDGFELARKISKDKDLNKIPVIVLSGIKQIITSDFEVKPDEQWLPVASFIDKPVKPALLMEHVNNLIRTRS